MAYLQQPLGQYFFEDFNRSDNSSLGSNWRTDSGSASTRILSNAAEARSMSSNTGRNGCWNTWIGGNNDGKFLTDNYRVRAQLKAPSQIATNNFTGIVLVVPDTYSSSTLCTYFIGQTATAANGSGIITQANVVSSPYNTSGQTGQTVRVTTNQITTTSLIELERIGNVFNAYVNGTNTCTWTDSGNLVPTGSTNRRWGIITEGNFPIFQSQFDSPAIDWVEAFDL